MRRPLDLLALVVIVLAILLPLSYAVQDAFRVRSLSQEIDQHRSDADRLNKEGQYRQARAELEQVVQLRLFGTVRWTEPTAQESRDMHKYWDTWLIREKASTTAADPDAKKLNEMIDTRLSYRFLGSRRCLMCHSALHRVHMETWQAGKMAKTFARVQETSKEDLEKFKCYQCHTTGYNPITKEYSEPGVTCEACHGPGEVFAHLMATGRASQGKVYALGNIWRQDGNPCARCHSPKRIPHPRKAY